MHRIAQGRFNNHTEWGVQHIPIPHHNVQNKCDPFAAWKTSASELTKCVQMNTFLNNKIQNLVQDPDHRKGPGEGGGLGQSYITP